MTFKEQMANDENEIKKVSGFCSQCGRIGPCELGIIEDDGTAQAFCNSDCMGEYNLLHGLGYFGEILPQPGDVECPECFSKNHESKYIAYCDGYNERAYHCLDCGYIFVRLTK